MKRRPAGWLLCLLGLTLLVGCSDGNPAAPGDNQVHLTGWDLSHVAEAVTDTTPCAACHGSDYRGSGPVPGCYDCHFGPDGSQAPAGSGWIHGDIPHDTLLSSGLACNACHRILRQAGSGPAACHDCHVGITHPTGQPWLDSNSLQFHGIAAGVSNVDCQRCHGSDFLGGTSGISCFACHFDETGSRVPPGSGWSHGDSHTTLSTYESVCTTCHGLSRAYNNGPNACHDCHDAHATGATWLLPANHAAQSIANRVACLACHDLATGGSGISPACGSCHKLSNPPLSTGQCNSCHGRPPSGSAFPNRAGQHDDHKDFSCATCHRSAGSNSLNHWYPDPTAPANFNFTGTGVTYSGGRCSGNCHEDHNNRSWY